MIDALEEVILLPAKIKDENGNFIPNPEIIGGLTMQGVQALKANNARLYKWGITNQRYLEEINNNSQDVEIEE